MQRPSSEGRLIVGNAAVDGAERRGWLVGHFAGQPGTLTSSEDAEIKWVVHPSGERREMAAVNATATTLSILVRGRFRLRFVDRVVVLAREGDYALWGPGIAHD